MKNKSVELADEAGITLVSVENRTGESAVLYQFAADCASPEC